MEHPRRNEVQWIDVSNLFLDPENPRLPEYSQGAGQTELLQIIAHDFSLAEIGQSLADNGYFSEEPLVAVPRGDNNDTYTVVEGNRRLAALRLLLDPELARRHKLFTWVKLSDTVKHPLTPVPVLVYDRREQILPYLGFRHFTGILTWDPLSKARFIAQLKESTDRTFRELSREIGSKMPTVRNFYVSYAILRQARDAFDIDTTPAEQDFGVFRRSVSDPNIREFLGIELDSSEEQLAKPISPKHRERLEEVLSWIFGDSDNRPVLDDSRQLISLGRVIANSEGLNYLRSTRDLEYALELIGGEEQRALDNLRSAKLHLDRAIPDVIRHAKNEEVAVAFEKCWDVAKEMAKLFSRTRDDLR